MQLTRLCSIILNRIRLAGRHDHAHAIGQAGKILDTVAAIARQHPAPDEHRPRIIGYLRKIDPTAFEEAILTAVERGNVRVTRNTRYTGDGGVDGRFHVAAGTVLVQAKRYQSAINPAHVSDFYCVVSQEPDAVYGLFVHTGRTGPMSQQLARGQNSVSMVSGGLMVDLLLGKLDVRAYVEKQLARERPVMGAPTQKVAVG